MNRANWWSPWPAANSIRLVSATSRRPQAICNESDRIDWWTRWGKQQLNYYLLVFRLAASRDVSGLIEWYIIQCKYSSSHDNNIDKKCIQHRRHRVVKTLTGGLVIIMWANGINCSLHYHVCVYRPTGRVRACKLNMLVFPSSHPAYFTSDDSICHGIIESEKREREWIDRAADLWQCRSNDLEKERERERSQQRLQY